MISGSDILGGIYIHVPFCLKKCHYCDFYSITEQSKIPAFLSALQLEVQLAGGIACTFDTLYIGGGTPSVLQAADIDQISEAVFRHFDVRSGAEVTLEVNPGTVTFESLREYRKSGINRLSIGVQSFHKANLDFLGRIHSPADALGCVDMAQQAGFDNVGLDLIYGVPGQDKQNWIDDLTRAIGMQPEHLACYMLTCESGTPLDQQVKAGRIRLPSDEILRQLFETTIEFLTSHGYVQYEISNFARATADDRIPRTCSHNQKYWSFAPYIGLGPSAHSFIEPRRYWNHRSVTKYIREIEKGNLPIAEKETLTREQLLMEAIYLGFRTTRGIELDRFEERFDIDFSKFYAKTIEQLESENLIRLSERHCSLTRTGLAFADSVASMFVCQ